MENKEDLLKIGVYTITNIINGKLYLGSTKVSFKERWRHHIKALKGGKHHSIKLQRAVDKYGLDNFKFEILDICDIEFVTSTEKYWLNLLNSVVMGYNISYSVEGGCLGYKHSVENKKIISESMLNNKHRTGIKHTNEIKHKIKNSTKNFFKSKTEYVKKLKKNRSENLIKLNKSVIAEKNKKPIYQINKETDEIIK